MQQSAPEFDTSDPTNWLKDFELFNTSGYSSSCLPSTCQPFSWNMDNQIEPASTSHQAHFERSLQSSIEWGHSTSNEPYSIPFADTAYMNSQARTDLCRTSICQSIGESMEKSALLSDQRKNHSIHNSSE